MTRQDIRAALNDEQALVATLYGEAAGEPLEGIVGVACAIRTRVDVDLGRDGRPDWWGEGYRGVCLAPAQFSCWWEANANTDRVYALALSLLEGRAVVDAEVGTVLAELQWIALGVIARRVRDNVRGADSYLTRRLYMLKPPTWATAAAYRAAAGSHVFFRVRGAS